MKPRRDKRMGKGREKNSGTESVPAITGAVMRGRGIGKHVGTPTANVMPESGKEPPEPGVYLSRVFLEERVFHGVTHIGTRPTLEDGGKIRTETFLLDFEGDLYGRTIRIELCQKIRNVKRFDELSSLLEQIRKDCATAQKFWGLRPESPCLNMDLSQRCVFLGRNKIRLTGKEFGLLHLLYSNPEKAFPREQIYETVWGEPSNHCCHAVENTVFQIRKKLRPYAGPCDYIKTIVGYGYQFSGDRNVGEEIYCMKKWSIRDSNP